MSEQYVEMRWDNAKDPLITNRMNAICPDMDQFSSIELTNLYSNANLRKSFSLEYIKCNSQKQKFKNDY